MLHSSVCADCKVADAQALGEIDGQLAVGGRLAGLDRQAVASVLQQLVAAAEVHDTMSFYGFFPQAPIGDVRVWICRSLSCMLRGGDELLEHACHRLAIEPGQTTPDGKLTVDFAECLGVCDFAPAALADDGRVYGPLDEEKVDQMIQEIRGSSR